MSSEGGGAALINRGVNGIEKSEFPAASAAGVNGKVDTVTSLVFLRYAATQGALLITCFVHPRRYQPYTQRVTCIRACACVYHVIRPVTR